MEPTENKKAIGAGNKEVILITGASGLIGRNLIKQLEDSFQIIGLDKVGNPTPSPKVENITFDITSEGSIKKGLDRVRYAYGSRIASVVHLAAYYDFSGEPSELYELVTVQGTQKFLKALQSFQVDQFIFSSTNLIYKPTSPGIKIAENCPLAPNWDYPESKIDTEKIIHEERGNIPAVLLRLAGVYNEEGNSIPISHQIQRIYEEDFESHLFSGDVSHGNVFIHIDDLIDAFVKTINKRVALPEEIAINIGEPETLSYKEIQDVIGLEIHGEAWKTFEVPKPIAKAGAWAQNLIGDSFIKPWMIDRADDHYELDISRAKELLDWEPKHSLVETLPLMIENLKKDPLRWYKTNKLDPPKKLKEKHH